MSFKQQEIQPKEDGYTPGALSKDSISDANGKPIRLHSDHSERHKSYIKLSGKNLENLDLSSCKTENEVIKLIQEHLRKNAIEESKTAELYQKYTGFAPKITYQEHKTQNHFIIWKKEQFVNKIKHLLDKNDINNINWTEKVKKPFALHSIKTNSVHNSSSNAEVNRPTNQLRLRVLLNTPDMHNIYIMSNGIANALQESDSLPIVASRLIPNLKNMQNMEFDNKYPDIEGIGKNLAVSFLVGNYDALLNGNNLMSNGKKVITIDVGETKFYDILEKKQYNKCIEKLQKSSLAVKKDFYDTMVKILNNEKKFINRQIVSNTSGECFFKTFLPDALKEVKQSIDCDTPKVLANKRVIKKPSRVMTPLPVARQILTLDNNRGNGTNRCN